MAIGIVDGFEVIDVEQRQNLRRFVHVRLEIVIEAIPVADLGELIGPRFACDPLFQRQSVTDEDRQVSGDENEYRDGVDGEQRHFHPWLNGVIRGVEFRDEIKGQVDGQRKDNPND